MQYNPLGNTGLYVSRLCLGAMTFGEGGHMWTQLIGATGQALADRMVGQALDAGINFFDTANIYMDGESESMLGKALGARRKDVIVATKVFSHAGTGVNDVGTSRLAIMREVEGSLKRLGSDYIDLYQVHSFDATTPLEETLSAMDDLVRQGKVRYTGLSNFAGWQIAKADGLARLLGTERFCSVQAYYSLAGRELEREILPAARDLGLGVMVWSPLAGGYLSGKFSGGAAGEGRRKVFNLPPVNLERGEAIVQVLKEIAAARGASPAQVALAWLLHQPGISTVILGARTEQQLIDNLGCGGLALAPDELERLGSVSKLPSEYPAWMPSRQRGGGIDAWKDAVTNMQEQSS
jgi:aryl-alcohol dehydrogenase-like predicted oxidoreductase